MSDNEMDEKYMRVFSKGIQVWALPIKQDVWQISVFTIGHERWAEYPDDHAEPEYITWYIQFLHWQISWTREEKYHHE